MSQQFTLTDVQHPQNARPGLVSVKQLVKVYGAGDTRVVALGGVTVDFQQGSFTAVMGPSGSGKST
ncbi:MAG: hypothetical protein FWD80_06365, partial [Propionibacteriaceae bacterium]|nr:hypothetical protein [Propionibacteriaceae bacterium]